jgi:hypothetical protein
VHLKKIQSAALAGDLAALTELMDLRENSKLAALKRVIVYITAADAKY